MSDIVERLQAANEWMRAPDWNDNLDDLELVSWLNRRPAGGFKAAIDEITRLTAEVERLRSLTVVQESLIRKFEAANEKLRAALRECELDLNAYYRMKYPGDHPHSQKELAQAMASNPATVALKEKP